MGKNHSMNKIEILRDLYKIFSRIQWRAVRSVSSYPTPMNFGDYVKKLPCIIYY